MTPLERAARALLALDYPEAVGSDAEGMYWDRRGDEYVEQARAVIAAIREPSELMAAAGYLERADGGTHSAIYAAMIDAMLEDR